MGNEDRESAPTPRPSRKFAIYAEACREALAGLGPLEALDDAGREIRHEAANLLMFFENTPEEDAEVDDRREAGARVFRMHSRFSSYVSSRR